MKVMAVDNIRPELAQKRSSAPQSRDHTRRILANVQMDNVEISAAVLWLVGLYDQKSHRMPARRHSPGNRQHLSFRPTHGERCKHIHDAHRAPHSARERLE